MAEILLIDDDRHITEVVEYVLQANGFAFSSAPDGDSGHDLFRRFRELVSEIPVIMLTSLGEEP